MKYEIELSKLKDIFRQMEYDMSPHKATNSAAFGYRLGWLDALNQLKNRLPDFD